MVSVTRVLCGILNDCCSVQEEHQPDFRCTNSEAPHRIQTFNHSFNTAIESPSLSNPCKNKFAPVLNARRWLHDIRFAYHDCYTLNAASSPLDQSSTTFQSNPRPDNTHTSKVTNSVLHCYPALRCFRTHRKTTQPWLIKTLAERQYYHQTLHAAGI